MIRSEPLDPILRIQYRLTPRDLTLLQWLADHGTLTTPQIANALFSSPGFAQRRLLALTDARVLSRFRPYLPEGGTGPYHYVLAQLGDDVASLQRGEEDLPRRDHAARRRQYLTNRANLPHLLAVNQFFTDLAGHARTHPDTSLERWWPSSRCQKPGTWQHLDPDSPHLYATTIAADGHGIWTHHPTSQPSTDTIAPSHEPSTDRDSEQEGTPAARTIPGPRDGADSGDLTDTFTERLTTNLTNQLTHAGPTTAPAAAAEGRAGLVRVPFFAEIDLGTEDHTRLAKKLPAYERFAEQTGTCWPVLFWFTSSVRERHFHAYLDWRLARHHDAYGRSVPVATASSDLTTAEGKTPGDAVWWLHGHGSQLRSLADLAPQAAHTAS